MSASLRAAVVALLCVAGANDRARVEAQTTTLLQAPDGGAVTTTTQPGGLNTIVITQGGPGGIVSGTTSAQPPQRDQVAPAVGSSRIRGRVTAADTGRPLRRAIVRLSSPGIREGRTTSTDQDGRYEFEQLPAASYNLTASKTGFLQTGYKQTRPGGPSRPVPLGDRENREGVDFALVPGGVITGRVVDEYGEPASDVFVSAQRQQFVNGGRRPTSVGAPSSTNDIGEFRIYGLTPGDYYVVASPRSPSLPFDASSDRIGYAQTYYPSAMDAAAAQRVTVGAGDLVSSIVVALVPTRTARVSGIVLDREGRPARGGNVSVMPRSGPGFSNANGFVRPDGTFTINGVAPGTYLLRAVLNGSPAGGMPQPPTFSIAPIVVDGADLSSVVLQPQEPLRFAGGSPAIRQPSPRFVLRRRASVRSRSATSRCRMDLFLPHSRCETTCRSRSLPIPAR
jgi:hypothetical protein